MDEFIKKFKIKQLTIAKFEYWTISLRPIQPTLGSMVVSLNRACYCFSDLSGDECKELSSIYRYIESKLGKYFSPIKYNYLTLMLVDRQVHFHAIPRYDMKVEFNGEEFWDKNWPRPINNLSDGTDNIELLLELKKCFVEGV